METPVVTLHTSMGDISLELYFKEAPRTCKNFFELARKGYYDGVKVLHATCGLLPASAWLLCLD